MSVFKDALGSLGLGTLSNIVSMPFEIAREKRNYDLQFQYNEKAAENAFNRQVDFWNMQNAYNTPSAQMARLRKAGLNPALMNSGGAQSNSAGGLSSVASGGVQNSSSVNPTIDLIALSKMSKMLKDGGLVDAETANLLQLTANSKLEYVLQQLVGKEQWLKIKDQASAMGYSIPDADYYDSFFGLGSTPSPDGISPTKDDSQLKQSQSNLNNQKIEESKSLVSLNEAERRSIETLLDDREALLQAQIAGYEIANDLDRRFGALQRNGQLMLNKAQYEKIKQEILHENLLIPLKRKLLNAQVDEATANAFLSLIQNQFSKLDYEYLQSWVGDESNWYDLIGRIIYELTTNSSTSASVKVGG